MASESHVPAALVSIVSLKCVLRVAVRLLGRAAWLVVFKFINIMGNIETLPL